MSSLKISFFVLVVIALMITSKNKETDVCRVSPGEFNQDTSVTARVGDNAILPCIPTFSISKVDDTFEWYKEDTELILIKENTVNSVHRSYAGRINEHALMEELDKGTASLILRNVTQSDSGNYSCRIHHDDTLSCVSVTLVVTKEEKDEQMDDENPETTTAPPAHQNLDKPLWVKILVPVVVLVVAVGTGIGICMWKKKKKESNTGQDRLNSQNSEENFEMTSLQTPTDNVSTGRLANKKHLRWRH